MHNDSIPLFLWLFSDVYTYPILAIVKPVMAATTK